VVLLVQVPSTLGPVAGLAWSRRELGELWNGSTSHASPLREGQSPHGGERQLSLNLLDMSAHIVPEVRVHRAKCLLLAYGLYALGCPSSALLRSFRHHSLMPYLLLLPLPHVLLLVQATC